MKYFILLIVSSLALGLSAQTVRVTTPKDSKSTLYIQDGKIKSVEGNIVVIDPEKKMDLDQVTPLLEDDQQEVIVLKGYTNSSAYDVKVNGKKKKKKHSWGDVVYVKGYKSKDKNKNKGRVLIIQDDLNGKAIQKGKGAVEIRKGENGAMILEDPAGKIIRLDDLDNGILRLEKSKDGTIKLREVEDGDILEIKGYGKVSSDQGDEGSILGEPQKPNPLLEEGSPKKLKGDVLEGNGNSSEKELRGSLLLEEGQDMPRLQVGSDRELAAIKGELQPGDEARLILPVKGARKVVITNHWGNIKVDPMPQNNKMEVALLYQNGKNIEAPPFPLDQRFRQKGEAIYIQVPSPKEGEFSSFDIAVKVPAKMDMEINLKRGGEVRVNGIKGSIQVDNQNGSTYINAASSWMTVNNFNGEIKAAYDDLSQVKAVSLVSFNGGVTLKVPDTPNADVLLQTRKNGYIHSDFIVEGPGGKQLGKAVKKVYQKDPQQLLGKIGNGGAKIFMITNNGPVEIIKDKVVPVDSIPGGKP